MALVILGMLGAVVVLAAAVTGLLISTEAEVERARATDPRSRT